MRHKTLITTIIILGMFFVLGATNELQAYNEARVRYILCDISLGGSIGYYRDFPNNPNAREALKRWRNGVRVLNLDEFEREMDFGVVYAGTCDIIDGMDVDLTTDHECRQCNHRHYITPGVRCVFPHINIIGNFHHRGHRWWVPPPPRPPRGHGRHHYQPQPPPPPHHNNPPNPPPRVGYEDPIPPAYAVNPDGPNSDGAQIDNLKCGRDR